MIEDYSAARFYLDLMVLFGLVLNAVFTWAVNRHKVNKAAIDRVDGRVAGVESRMTELEADVRHLPDRRDIDELHERVTLATQTIGEIKGELAGMSRTLSLIHQSLLEERNKS